MLEFDLTTITLSKIIIVYLAGVATSFTPCVYPIVPIVIGYLGGQKGSARQRWLAGLAYSLGLALVYTLLGLISALTGEIFGTLTTNSYFYIGFGLLILYFGGAMMEFYNIPVPRFLHAKAQTNAASSPRYSEAVLMGATSGLVASPCTAPVLGVLLLYIATEKAFVLGGLLMFVFALGMCTIILLIAFFAGLLSKLPQSGLWMVRIKQAMGFVMILGGLYFIFKAGQIW